MDDLLKTVSRVRRAMPRNFDVMTICDELERRLVKPQFRVGPSDPDQPGQWLVEEVKEDCPVCSRRRTNMRNLMRKKRSEAKK
jgi:hypothetical protein